jgi:butyryl-CoA dehydrogenase
VDRALAGVDPDDHPAVLKTIEEFAIECSINKVWTSEALAYAVDESLQVFGGNGYSREFPAERAYRDARITRIYEGTNEINRLIAGSRLAKSAAIAGQVTGAANALDEKAAAAAPAVGRLAAERRLLGAAKRVAAFTIGRAVAACGKALAGEQEGVAHIADMAMEIYAVESAILRAEKMAARDAFQAPTAADITAVYAADAGDRIEHAAKNALGAIQTGNAATGSAATGTAAAGNAAAPDAAARMDDVHRLLRHGPVNAVAARRRIADAVIAANRYPL